METNKFWLWIAGMLFIVAGFIFIFFSIFLYQHFSKFLCVTIGIGMIIVNLIPLTSFYNLMAFDRRVIIDYLCALTGVILGAFYIPFHNEIMSIICGAFLLILPTLRVIFSRHRLVRFEKEIPLYMIGIFLLLNMLEVVGKALMITYGGILIAFGIMVILSGYMVLFKRGRRKNTLNAKVKVLDPLQIEDAKEEQ